MEKSHPVLKGGSGRPPHWDGQPPRHGTAQVCVWVTMTCDSGCSFLALDEQRGGPPGKGGGAWVGWPVEGGGVSPL